MVDIGTSPVVEIGHTFRQMSEATMSLIIHKISSRKRFLATAIVAVILAGIVLGYYESHMNGTGSHCGCGSNFLQPSTGTHFTVVMSLNGFNDSRVHGLPWPIMNVTVGQDVTIHLVNCDNTQAHGFSIGIGSSTVYVRPVTIAAGQCLDVSFVATNTGTFVVQCTIFCTVHTPWMLNGKLNVNPTVM